MDINAPALDDLAQAIITGASFGGIYALVALGFGIVWRTTRVFNFAQGDFGTLGGYVCFALWVDSGWPLPLAIIAACVFVGLFSVVVERVALRPLYKRGLFYPIISTAGLAFAIQSGVRLNWGSIPRAFPTVFGDTAFSLGGVRMVPEVLVVFAITMGVALGGILFLERTKIGTAMRSCSQDREVSELLGIDVNRLFMIAFFMAGVLGAMTGILIAPINTLRPQMGLTLGLQGMVAALLGGLGSFPGAIVGGLILGVTRSVTVLVFDPRAGDITVFIVLILIVLFRPNGLFGATGRVRQV